jgi:hypothetical protein
VISFDKGKEIIEKEKRPPFLEKIKELVSNDSKYRNQIQNSN